MDDLERTLCDEARARYGPPPPPAATWAALAPRLAPRPRRWRSPWKRLALAPLAATLAALLLLVGLGRAAARRRRGDDPRPGGARGPRRRVR